MLDSVKHLSVLFSVILFVPSAGWAQSKAGVVQKLVTASERAAEETGAALRGAGRVSADAVSLERFVKQKMETGMRNAAVVSREDILARLKKNALSQTAAANMQMEVLRTSWTQKEMQLLMLRDLPLLPIKHGYSLVPSVSSRAVGVYRNLLENYQGSVSFAQEQDLESWAKMISAVSNLGFFGTAQDADYLVKVYNKVPAQAKQVTALAVIRSLLSLGCSEEVSQFARVAAQDGALSEEFAAEMDNRTEKNVAPNAQEREKMYQAVIKFTPFGSLYFDHSSTATAQWLRLNKSIRGAASPLDLNGFARWQEEQLASMDFSLINEILTRPDSPCFQGLSKQGADNLVHAARTALVKRFKWAHPNLAQLFDVRAIAQLQNFEGVSDSSETLRAAVEKKLDAKKAEFTEFVSDAEKNRHRFNAVWAEFRKFYELLPDYDWGDLPKQFLQIKEETLTVEQRRVRDLKELAASLEKNLTVGELGDAVRQLETLAKDSDEQGLHMRVYHRINDVLLSNDTPAASPAQGKALEILLNYQADFYRRMLSVPLYRNGISEQEALAFSSTWSSLQNKFPNKNYNDVNGLFAQSIEEDKYLQKMKLGFRESGSSLARLRRSRELYLYLREEYPDYNWGISQYHFEVHRNRLLNKAFQKSLGGYFAELEYFAQEKGLWEQGEEVKHLKGEYYIKRDNILDGFPRDDWDGLEEAVKRFQAKLQEVDDDFFSKGEIIRAEIETATAAQRQEETSKTEFLSRWWNWWKKR